MEVEPKTGLVPPPKAGAPPPPKAVAAVAGGVAPRPPANAPAPRPRFGAAAEAKAASAGAFCEARLEPARSRSSMAERLRAARLTAAQAPLDLQIAARAPRASSLPQSLRTPQHSKNGAPTPHHAALRRGSPRRTAQRACHLPLGACAPHLNCATLADLPATPPLRRSQTIAPQPLPAPPPGARGLVGPRRPARQLWRSAPRPSPLATAPRHRSDPVPPALRRRRGRVSRARCTRRAGSSATRAAR